MKPTTLFSILFSLALSTNIFAQGSTSKYDCPTFNGHKIEGNVDSFKNLLLQDGFTYVRQMSSGYVFDGNYMGYHDCEIYVFCAPDKSMLQVVIWLKKNENWDQTFALYNEVKTQLSAVYGDSDDGIEMLRIPTDNPNISEWEALDKQDAAFYSSWEVGNCKVLTDINPEHHQVRIVLENAKNMNLYKAGLI